MKILLLTPQLPYPPRQGTTIRNFNLIKYLAQNHVVDLLSFLAPSEQLAADSQLHALCNRIDALPQPTRTLADRARATFGSPLPDMALRLESALMHRRVREWCTDTEYDVIQIEGIEMAQYGGRITGRADLEDPSPVVVFDDHNCEYLLQRRNALNDLRQPRRWAAAAYSFVQWAKLRRYEAMVGRRVDAVLAVSEPDRNALQDLVSDRNIIVVPNGIDIAAYAAIAAHAPDAAPTLVFTGKMDYRPNIDAMLWFGRHVLPLIHAQQPEVHVQIVGMNPSSRLDELGAIPQVRITGAVDDTRPYIFGANIYIIPMRVGGGTRFKALEAMASAKPIVSTTLGVEGIPVHHEQELLLANTPATFADAVLRLLRDQQETGVLSARLGANARAFVAAHFSWRQILPELEQIYAKAKGYKSAVVTAHPA